MNTPEVPPPAPPDAMPMAPAADASADGSGPSSNGHGKSPEDGAHDSATGPAAPALEAGGQPGVGSPNGTAEKGGESPDATEASGEPAAAEASGAPAAEAPPGQERKRRRRRRKRKSSTLGSKPEGVPEEAEDSASENASAEASVDGERIVVPEKRPKKKERRQGPPRERPPVNAGDIVFGKIIDITDEAILIDIPGKAHAIFDRREMALPDDDEPAPATGGRANGAEGNASETTAEPGTVTSVESPASEPEADAEGLVGGSSAPEPSVPPEQAPTAVTDGVAVVNDAVEPPKDPKVPRVILEVGADFIGVVHGDGSRGGLVVLTHHPHRAERTKLLVEKAFADGTMVEGLVTGVIKGGIEVDVDGLRAFAPGSHVDLRLGADVSHLVAKRLPFLVTQYAKRGRDVVLSRRAVLEEEARKARVQALARLKVGDELDGVVRSVVAFGAFVDVGGIEGLVPLQEMSHNRADGPSDVFKAGEPTRVKVLKIDDRGKIWLSHKATIADPWQQVAQKYAVGTRHTGKVARLHPFGAFIELEPGIDGLIHTQDLSIKRIDSPEEVVKVDDSIDVVVVHVDSAQHRIGLHPALQGDAANEPAQRVIVHKAVKAKVVVVEAGGILVRILGVTGRNARGYITAAGTGTPRGTELRKVFAVGQEIEAKVIEIDPRRGEAKLSIKALSDDQERSAYQQYRQQLKAEARFTFGDLLAKKSPPR